MFDAFKLMPYAWRAFQQRASIGLLQEDILAVYEKAKPAIEEARNRWPEMEGLTKSMLYAVLPEEMQGMVGPNDGMWKPSMLWAQRDLKKRGLYKGEIDGKNGPQMIQAVTKFQVDAGFKEEDVDGMLGEKTIGAMLAHPIG